MATTERFKLEPIKRQNRYFSEGIKRQKVKDLEKNLVTISELCREYQVSRTSVYRWIYQYSVNRKRQEKQIVEKSSDTRKIKELQDRVKELERIIGQKQLLLDFKDKMIEIAEEMYQVDIKKKLSSTPFNGTGKTGRSIPTGSTKSTKRSR
jgi:transposase-like protein